ncbi:hypothetical protein ACIP6P_05195 [Streptomyces sp. NPDC088729]|uniref:hypothetical protein n=1 Tax=Streptomyces sp. NPDC088729 TaxID=3365876 RepID=UPI00381D71D4
MEDGPRASCSARQPAELPLMNATVDRLRHDKPLAGHAVLVTGHFLGRAAPGLLPALRPPAPPPRDGAGEP